MSKDFYTSVETVCEKDSRYKVDAYVFVMEALAYSQKKYKRYRHVSGRELLEGIKDLAIEDFGPLAQTVLEYWGVSCSGDFGHIVFNMVNNNILSKEEDDSIETFQNAFDFEEEFVKKYRNKLHQRIKRMRTIN